MRRINKVEQLSVCSLPSLGILLLAPTFMILTGCDITPSQNDVNEDHWTRLNSGTSEVLWDVDFVDANNGWVVGGLDDDIILRTKDGGETWIQQMSPVDDYLFAVDFQDANTGWIAGKDFILGTNDGGNTWQVQYQQELEDGHFRDVHFLDNNVGWVVGGGGFLGSRGVLLKTMTGGEHWETVEVTLPTIAAISFIDKHHGWICGAGGVILTTKDGGETWEKNKLAVTPAPFLTSIQFVDLKHGWTGSRDDWLGFYRTTDGGNSWIQRSKEPLELSGVQTFFFLDPLNGWLSIFPGRPYEICKTTDGGKTWDFYEALDATTTIHSLCFLNEELGWAVGWDGAIYRYTKN